MKYLLFVLVLMAVLLTAGCSSGDTETVSISTQTPAQTVIPLTTTTPQITEVSTPSLTYKNAELLFGVNPEYGFSMDYPSNWTYANERNHAWYLSSERVGQSCGWSPGYNFSSPDKQSHVFVMWANKGDLERCLAPLDEWAEKCVKSMIANPYCLDGAGNRMGCGDQPSQKYFYHSGLTSDETVTLSGNVEARKLIFTSYDDRYAGWDTFYLMYAGRIQGYNYSVPNQYGYFEEANGSVWDCGKGGIRYAIYLYTPENQVYVNSYIFRHMMNSFHIIPPEISHF